MDELTALHSHDEIGPAAYLEHLRGTLDPETLVILNLSGRGDKDMDEFNIRFDEQNGDSTGDGGAFGTPTNGLFC